jgi:hypothetical protein
MNVKDEINKAIGVAKARIDYVNKYEDIQGDSFEECEVLRKAICSLEKWRDSDSTRHIPDVARQMIWFKQQALLSCAENNYAIDDYTIP